MNRAKDVPQPSSSIQWTVPRRRGTSAHDPAGTRSLREMVDGYEKNLILIALSACDGNQRRASRLLGLLPSTLNEKMRRFRIRATDQPSGVAADPGAAAAAIFRGRRSLNPDGPLASDSGGEAGLR